MMNHTISNKNNYNSIIILLILIIIGAVLLYFDEVKKDNCYQELLSAPADKEILYIPIDNISNYKNKAERINKLAEKYKKANYKIIINKDTIIAEKKN